MAITRIDCNFFRGKNASLDTSSFVALNPRKEPGSLVVANSTAARDSIGNQVACKLALEHFVDGVLDYYEAVNPSSGDLGGTPVEAKTEQQEISLSVLENAFKRANNSVYQFGHQLAAGGRMAASLMGLVIEESVVAAGRVASGSAYLYRGRELFPFFEGDKHGPRDPVLGEYIGANSLVSVELASVPIEESDTIVAFSRMLTSAQERHLIEWLAELDLSDNRCCAYLARTLFNERESLAFSMVARIGPETIYLNKAVGLQST